MKYKKIDPSKLDIKNIYHLLISGISPRPIALVSSQNKNGINNLAPFSFFNAFGANPPIIGFSPALSGRTGLPKDTLLNIKEVNEFTVSIVNSNIVEQISLSSCEYASEVNEFEKSGFSELKSIKIIPPGVKESYFVMECKLIDIVELGNKPASGNLILGEVVMFHIDNSIIDKKNIVDPFKLDSIARNGGNWYTKNNEGLFEIKKPKNIGIGFDCLPKIILNSDLTGNELARLASIEKIPKYIDDNSFNELSKHELMDCIKLNIENNKIIDAWNVVLYMQGIYDE